MACEWYPWSDVDGCSKLCGGGDETGTKLQERKKKKSAQNGGYCSKEFSRRVNCTSKIDCPGTNCLYYSYLDYHLNVILIYSRSYLI